MVLGQQDHQQQVVPEGKEKKGRIEHSKDERPEHSDVQEKGQKTVHQSFRALGMPRRQSTNQMRQPYEPIEDYGVIGNMRTVALVSRTGSIDWFCYPNFDSPSVFAALLDAKKGGHFRIFSRDRDLTHKQLYWPDTNILITRFLGSDGLGEIIDYMPVVPREGHGYDGIIRVVKVIRGEMRFRAECRPAFNYARDAHETEIVKGGVNFTPALSIFAWHRKWNGGGAATI